MYIQVKFEFDPGQMTFDSYPLELKKCKEM